MQLEDTFFDVIGKAARGRGLNPEGVAQRAGCLSSEGTLLQGAGLQPDSMDVLAHQLGLRASSLVALAAERYQPPAIRPPAGFFMSTTPFDDMTVNAYLIWDPATREAAVFDSGADAEPLLAKIEMEKLAVKSIFITHSHGDHVYDIDRLAEKTGAQVWTPEGEPFDGGEAFVHGRVFAVGGLRIESRRTAGHSVAGASYVVQGLDLPLVIVGDALFAGSIGGAKIDYTTALEDIRTALFSLRPSTIVCPGHGPLTTIGFEREQNPFFPTDEDSIC